MTINSGRAFFRLCRLRGPNFDRESHPHAEVRDIVGVRLYLSGQDVYPSLAQVNRWAELARANPGFPVDCFNWIGEGEDRKPGAAARLTYVIPKEEEAK